MYNVSKWFDIGLTYWTEIWNQDLVGDTDDASFQIKNSILKNRTMQL